MCEDMLKVLHIIKFHCIGKMIRMSIPSKPRELILTTKWLLVIEKILNDLNSAPQITHIHQLTHS